MSSPRSSISVLALSAAALVGFLNYEKFVPTTYIDPVGIPTIGFGTTSGVKPGQKITVERALIVALADANTIAKEVQGCISVPLAQYEFDSFVSLAYNIGGNAFCKSTLVKKVNLMDYAGACKEILRWNKAGGKVLDGLTKRRQSEFKMCMGEV
jgi:lysozyme